MLRSPFTLLIILLAAPACAGSHIDVFHGGGFRDGSFPAFHRSRRRARSFFGGYVCGYNCALGFDSGGYDYGHAYGYGGGNGYGYGGGAGNAVSSSNGSTGGYVPNPVGADIPPLIIPTNCWVRRAAYHPSGAYFGQVLVNLCRPSNSASVTGLKARVKTPDTGAGTGQAPPLYQSGAAQSPP